MSVATLPYEMESPIAAYPTAPACPCDLRRSARFSASLDTLCRILASGQEPAEAWVNDLSAEGAGLFVENRYEPGTALVVELGNDQRGRAVQLRARVVHADIQLPNDAWLIGVVFDRPLTDDQLADLLP